ncbi:10819_t:CDS:2, partial [Racocetra persica]
MNIGHKLIGVTTDNASNMIAIGRVLKERMHNEFSNINVQHFRCGAHILNIIVEEGIKSVNDLRLIFRGLIIHLNNNENLVINTQHAVANAMKVKFMSYWAHLNESSAILGLLDPHNKLSTYDITECEQTINKLHEVYQIYKLPEEKKLLPPTTATKSTQRFFRNLTKCHQSNLNRYEIEKYFSEPETEADPLPWWKANSNQFPVLARIAMDILAVQSTSVPSEQAFFIARNTISLTRNRINPEVTHASLCLKSWFTELGDMLKE